MIRSIRLANFKCFNTLDLPCSPLTLLCGLNGAGKSTVIQALLLLRQSFESGDLGAGRLRLGGPLVDLGTGKDVLSEDAASDSLGLGFEITGTPGFTGEFRYERAGNTLEAAAPLSLHEAVVQVPPVGGHVVYVNAERVGPRKLYPRSKSEEERGFLGQNGEYAWNLLAGGSHTLAKSDPRCGSPEGRRLRDASNHWLQEVSPGARLEFDLVEDADSILAGFAFERKGDVATRRYRATHVGFGLSYTLPVILGLLMPAGSLVLIENPEAHLHPRGQTRLAELSVRAGLAGVQVIVETHSDHFMDGVRIAVRDALIPAEMVRFHYFARSGTVASVTSPELDSDGRLSEWPSGFFDQHEANLARLLSPRD